MNVALKLGGFVLALGAVFGVAFLTGTQSQALLAPVETHDTELGGVAASVDGYTLTAVQPDQQPAADTFVEFAVTGPDGQPPILAEVDDAHLHLVAFRRDLTGFQHVYPEQGEGTSWWAVLDLTPGPWHVTVELQPEALGRTVLLGADLTVSGDYRAQPLGTPVDQVETAGLTVTRTGTVTTDPGSRTELTVSRAGQPVTDLQPGHGDLGHALLVRPGDLASAHLHAVETTATGPRLAFDGGPPEPGSYRLFVEFFRDDQLVVAPFTVEATR